MASPLYCHLQQVKNLYPCAIWYTYFYCTVFGGHTPHRPPDLNWKTCSGRASFLPAASSTPPTNLLHLVALANLLLPHFLGPVWLTPPLTSASLLLREMLTSIWLKPSPQSDFLPFLCQQKNGLLLPVLASSAPSRSATWSSEPQLAWMLMSK